MFFIRQKLIHSTFALAGAAALFAPTSAMALSIGQIDTFETGTTLGWHVAELGSPNPAPPAVDAGGPSGASDHFLELTALGGSGPASKLSVMNGDQWTGDYLAAGITNIGMDVSNFGQADLYLRLAFEDPGAATPPSNIAFSTDAILVGAGTGWVHVDFPVAPAFLTAGLGSVDTVLGNTTTLRLYHSQAPGFPNPVFPIASVVGVLGVDNITAGAAAVPEPATAFLFIAGAAFMARRRRR